MGQSAYSNGYVRFDTVENAVGAFNEFLLWAKEQNERDDVDFYIEDINVDDDSTGVGYVVSSAKISNCEWQCEEIRDWFKKQPGCQRITQDIITCAGSVNWEKDFDEEDENLRDAEEKIKTELGVTDVSIG